MKSAYFEFWYFFKMIQWLHGQSSLKLYEVTTPLKISIGNQDKRIRLVSIHFSFFQEFSLFPGAFRRLKPRLNKVFNKAWIRGVSGLFLAFRKIWIFTNSGGFPYPGEQKTVPKTFYPCKWFLMEETAIRFLTPLLQWNQKFWLDWVNYFPYHSKSFQWT